MNHGRDCDDLVNFVAQLPKVELHAHLNGCIREETLLDLSRQKGIEVSTYLHHSVHFNAKPTSMHCHSVAMDGRRRNLLDCFKIFDEIHACVMDVAALRRITREALEDFALENVVYLELRSTPRRLYRSNSESQDGREAEVLCSKRDYIEAIIAEFEAFESYQIEEMKKNREMEHILCDQLPLVPRYLVSIDRSGSVEDAIENVELAIKLTKENSYVVGVDLGGNPHKNDFGTFESVFQVARDAGLKVSLHCGEIPFERCDNEANPGMGRAHDETRAMVEFGPDRIGHALSLPPDIEKTLAEKRIPIECCPTSNVMTLELVHHRDGHMVDGLKKHPQLSTWLKTNYPISISTDDPGVFFTNSTRELLLVAKAYNLTKESLVDIIIKSVEHIFEPSTAFKRSLLNDMTSRIGCLLEKYSL